MGAIVPLESGKAYIVMSHWQDLLKEIMGARSAAVPQWSNSLWPLNLASVHRGWLRFVQDLHKRDIEFDIAGFMTLQTADIEAFYKAIDWGRDIDSPDGIAAACGRIDWLPAQICATVAMIKQQLGTLNDFAQGDWPGRLKDQLAMMAYPMCDKDEVEGDPNEDEIEGDADETASEVNAHKTASKGNKWGPVNASKLKGKEEEALWRLSEPLKFDNDVSPSNCSCRFLPVPQYTHDKLPNLYNFPNWVNKAGGVKRDVKWEERHN
ncbi:hypothetical protein Rhopal_006268-T1 [Rhodotorula paludigena]|uniref:Uncharacterized protein n=1 Tax=Rhodotorula paludigena TaxID=86838 RepID=A0AAV5GUN7_9BASI|nr:hypothetical protein Rhopal_006268-T1 [Rhodotorula paludigena]